MLGQFWYPSYYSTLLFGGSVGAVPTSDVWTLSKQSASRLLIAAPAGLNSPDTATNLTFKVHSADPNFFGTPLYIWNGGNSRWDFLAQPILGGTYISLLNPLAYLQPNGSFYFLMNSRNRSTPTNPNTSNVVTVDGLEVTIGFQ